MEYYSEAVKAHYLDASALVKLVADDRNEAPGREELRKYYRQHSGFLATSYCVSEALNVLKVKHMYRHELTKQEYLDTIKRFITGVIGGKLEIDELPILSPKLLQEAEILITKHTVDFIDCAQIVTVKHGRFSVLAGDSKSVLITADKELARVARQEGVRVWECTSEVPPTK